MAATEPVVPAQKVMLIVIDGWGVSKEVNGNAILNTPTPVMSGFEKEALYSVIAASGEAVGLPEGVMGNSEVGHLTIGAGQREFQDLVKINKAVREGKLATNPALVEAFETAKKGNGRLHFLGLLSNGGVHSHINHLKAMLATAKDAGVPQCFVQVFTDGRDTDPKSGVGFIDELQQHMDSIQYGSIATVMGRFYAMDRDKRWDRIKLSYEGLVGGRGDKTTKEELHAHIEAKYNATPAETDEFLKPIIVNEEGLIKDGDVMVYYDFRADRMREPCETFGSEILGVKRNFETDLAHPTGLHLFQMTQYKSEFPFPILFPPQRMENVLGEWLSKKGLTQFHTAETEKYAHVTFFFNGGREAQFAGEERRLCESPRGVPTYDLAPHMAAEEVANSVIEALRSGKYPFVMCNFAPPDMVGHTGNYEATLDACQFTDGQIGRIYEVCKELGYCLCITADHGNAEYMIDKEGRKVTTHSTNPVPFIIANAGDKVRLTRTEGGLEDVAPTILAIMKIEAPANMTGTSMVQVD